MIHSILVIGESHTRVFSCHQIIPALIIDSNRDNCFFSHIKYKNIKDKIHISLGCMLVFIFIRYF